MIQGNRLRLSVLAALLVSLTGAPASAVSLSNDGRGQVLLYPYYSVRSANDTAISVVNPTTAGKALKVRLLEGSNGRPVLDLNLYLGAGDSWAAVLTRNGAGEPILRVSDTSCTVPTLAASPSVAGAREVTLSNAAYANYDRAGSGFDRAKEGYVEILEMGEVDPVFNLPGGGTMLEAISSEQRNCAALAAGWQTGGVFTTSGGAELSAPGGGLFGGMILINVPEGTDYTYDPVALTKVFATKRHTAPGSSSPSLNDSSPTSLVIVDDQPIRSTWNNGVDAVTAVLMHRTLLNEYTVDSALAASTDAVVTFPTKAFYVARESDIAGTTRAPFSARFDDMEPVGSGATGPLLADGASTGACEPMAIERTSWEGRIIAPIDFGTPPQGLPDPGRLCWAANVISFGNVFSSANAVDVIYHPTGSPAGLLAISLSLGSQPRTITSTEGHTYFGLPAIGFVAQKYVNGNLPSAQGTILSNYGGTFAHKYVIVVE